MTLSDSSENVVWELNELLAAQQRAKKFSMATLSGEINPPSDQFVPQNWGTDLNDREDSESEAHDVESENCVSDGLADDGESGTADASNEAETGTVEPEDMYAKGFEDGRNAVEEERAKDRDDVKAAMSAIRSQLDTLPPLWREVRELSLHVAEVVSLGVLGSNEQLVIEFINNLVEKSEVPSQDLVRIKVSKGIFDLLCAGDGKLVCDGRELPLEIGAELDGLDVQVDYELGSIERSLTEQISQVRTQLEVESAPMALETTDE